MESLVDKFTELIAAKQPPPPPPQGAEGSGEGGEDASASPAKADVGGDVEEGEGLLGQGLGLTPQQFMHLTKLRNHFHKDVRKQLYSDVDDRNFFEALKQALKAIEKRLEDSAVALQHLEMALINVACDDPGAMIGTQLALPILQERLDARALEHAAQRAKFAEDEVLRMEVSACMHAGWPILLCEEDVCCDAAACQHCIGACCNAPCAPDPMHARTYGACEKWLLRG